MRSVRRKAGLGWNEMAPVRYNRMRDDTITLVCGRRNALFCKCVFKLMLLRSILDPLFFRSDYCNYSCFHRLPSAYSTIRRSPQQKIEIIHSSTEWIVPSSRLSFYLLVHTVSPRYSTRGFMLPRGIGSRIVLAARSVHR